MKIIAEPKVHVVAHTTFLGHPDYEIPDDGDNHTKLGSFSAKICYDSVGKNGRSNDANQRAVLAHRHGSVAEHATVSLFIEGITRGLTLELNRHRTFAISQRSTRYTAEEDAAIVLEPYYADIYRRMNGGADELPNFNYTDETIFSPFISDGEGKLLYDFLRGCEEAITVYQTQVAQLEQLNPMNLTGFDLRKWARGKARNVLPHALETRGTWTNNHRGWRWFIEARSDAHAEPEIRRLAYHVYEALKEVAPLYYEDFEVSQIYDNIPMLVPRYSKI